MDDPTCAHTRIGEHAAVYRRGAWPHLGVRASWLAEQRAHWIAVYAGRDASYIIARGYLLAGRQLRTHWGVFLMRPIYEWDAQGCIADLLDSMRRIGAPVNELPPEVIARFGASRDEFGDLAP